MAATIIIVTFVFVVVVTSNRRRQSSSHIDGDRDLTMIGAFEGERRLFRTSPPAFFLLDVDH